MKKKQTHLIGAATLSIATLAISNGAVAEGICGLGDDEGAIGSFRRSEEMVDVFYKTPTARVELFLKFHKLADSFLKIENFNKSPGFDKFIKLNISEEILQRFQKIQPMVSFLKLDEIAAKVLVEDPEERAGLSLTVELDGDGSVKIADVSEIKAITPD